MKSLSDTTLDPFLWPGWFHRADLSSPGLGNPVQEDDIEAAGPQKLICRPTLALVQNALLCQLCALGESFGLNNWWLAVAKPRQS
ncbi:Protein Percc1 [Manis pentadactyla]|nr:Protein Percc1 [Manis pentadactyla]